MKDQLIHQLKDNLLLEGCSVEKLPATIEIPFEHLKLDLGLDSKKRQISALIWIFGKPKVDQRPPAKHDDLFVQIFITFPFHYVTNTLASLSRYVLLVNKVALFPGFGISEHEKSIYFKYTLCFYKGLVKAELIANVIGAIQFLYDGHLETIESLALGKTTFEEITKLQM